MAATGAAGVEEEVEVKRTVPGWVVNLVVGEESYGSVTITASTLMGALRRAVGKIRAPAGLTLRITITRILPQRQGGVSLQGTLWEQARAVRVGASDGTD